MQPATRHDIALLFARSLAVFALYEPFISICSTIAIMLMAMVVGSANLNFPGQPKDTFQLSIQYIHFIGARLIAFYVLWRLAPSIARWISSTSPAQKPVKRPAGSDIAGTPWASDPGFTAK
jgi:hypothetical protein